MKRAFFSPGKVKSKPKLRKKSSAEVTTITSRMFRLAASSTHARTSCFPRPSRCWSSVTARLRISASFFE